MNGWDAAYLLAAPAFLGTAAYRRWRTGKYRRSLPGMFGANLPDPPLAKGDRVWAHAVSVGETVASAAVLRRLREARPAWDILATTTTETGQDHARRILPADHFDFAPVDFSWKVRAFLKAYNPSIYLFFETEIWPNILGECGRRRLPIFMINGKLSERSARRYFQWRGPFQGVLRPVRRFLMQTPEDAARMERILGSGRRISVVGNVKFDNLPAPLNPKERAELRASWGLDSQAPVLAAGSTHAPEEDQILEAYLQLRRDFPGLRLVLAPRHPERFEEVARLLERRGLPVRRTSRAGTATSPESVVLIDEMGVLGRAFGAADVALVGGSWKPVGGHNLLEPAIHGVPVVHGPHMHEQKEIMRIVRAAEATLEAPERELAPAIRGLLRDEAGRRELGERGRAAAQANAGAARRAVDLILQDL